MKRIFFSTGVGIIISIVLVSTGCRRRGVETIHIYGSTTIEPYMKAAAAEYSKRKKTVFIIEGQGSRNGIDSLIAGACDIAMSSMEITPDEMARAKEKKIPLKAFLLGYDILTPIVHPSNSVTDISYENLKKVYSGKLTSWALLDGPDTAIDVIDRSPASGTYSVWHREVVAPYDTNLHFNVLPSNNAILAYIAAHINAIGYVSIVFVNPEVKALKLDGIAITETDSLLADYHLKRPLYLYVNEDRFGSEARQFIMFLLIDERGRALLHKVGFFSSFSLAPLFNAVEKASKR